MPLVGEMNKFELPGEGIMHMRGFKSLSSAKATLRGIEAIRTIKRGHVRGEKPGVTGEIRFADELFGLAA